MLNITKNLRDDAFETIADVIQSSIVYEIKCQRKGQIVINLGMLYAMSKAIINKSPGLETLCLRFAEKVSDERIPMPVIKEVGREKVWLNFEEGYGWYASEEKIV